MVVPAETISVGPGAAQVVLRRVRLVPPERMAVEAEAVLQLSPQYLLGVPEVMPWSGRLEGLAVAAVVEVFQALRRMAEREVSTAAQAEEAGIRVPQHKVPVA
jgi:hypothetical protein